LPVRQHPLAAIKARVFLPRPSLLIAPRLKVGLGALGQIFPPGSLERGTGLVERFGRAAALFAGIRAGVKAA
jgi:hypothetical protein